MSNDIFAYSNQNDQPALPQNQFNNVQIDPKSFAYHDLLSQDSWGSFTPLFSITVVGTATYTGRYKIVGKQCYWQVQAVATTSIASTAGTSYLTLPISAKGLTGMGVMTNSTTNIAVGVCHIDVTNSRCYLPTQAASGNTFMISGWHEIG